MLRGDSQGFFCEGVRSIDTCGEKNLTMESFCMTMIVGCILSGKSVILISVSLFISSDINQHTMMSYEKQIDLRDIFYAQNDCGGSF